MSVQWISKLRIAHVLWHLRSYGRVQLTTVEWNGRQTPFSALGSDLISFAECKVIFSPCGCGLVGLAGCCLLPVVSHWHQGWSWQCVDWHLSCFWAPLGRARCRTNRCHCQHMGKRCHRVAFAHGRCQKLTSTSWHRENAAAGSKLGTGSELIVSVLARAYSGKSTVVCYKTRSLIPFLLCKSSSRWKYVELILPMLSL